MRNILIILVFISDEYVKVKPHKLCNASLSTLEESKTHCSFQHFLSSEAPHDTVLSKGTHVEDVWVKSAFPIAAVTYGVNESCQFNEIHRKYINKGRSFLIKHHLVRIGKS